MKKEFLKQNKGITLIALVITIIVLLILAGIAISMLSGENGILKQAAKAKTDYEAASKTEEARLESTALQMDLTAKGISDIKSSNGAVVGVKNDKSSEEYETVEQLKARLPKEYNIVNADGTSMDNTGVEAGTGMIVKKDNQEVGRIVIYGDIDGNGIIDYEDAYILDLYLINALTRIENEYGIKIQDYHKLAMDVNFDKLINIEDYYLINLYDSYIDVGLVQNKAAQDPKLIKVEDYTTTIKRYVESLDDELQSKFTWSDENGYYSFNGITNGTTVEGLWDILPNKIYEDTYSDIMVYTGSNNQLDKTETIQEGDIIKLYGRNLATITFN